jgi:hypothetical protein
MQPYSNPTRRNMDDDLNIFEHGRRPQNKIMQPKASKGKTIIFLELEDDLHFFKKGRRPQLF